MCAGMESEPPPFSGRVPSRGEVSGGEAQVAGLRGAEEQVHVQGRENHVAETESLFDGSVHLFGKHCPKISELFVAFSLNISLVRVMRKLPVWEPEKCKFVNTSFDNGLHPGLFMSCHKSFPVRMCCRSASGRVCVCVHVLVLRLEGPCPCAAGPIVKG